MKQFEEKFMLRFPDGWRASLKKRADKNHRSMNAEILFILEPAIFNEVTGGNLGGATPVTNNHHDVCAS